MGEEREQEEVGGEEKQKERLNESAINRDISEKMTDCERKRESAKERKSERKRGRAPRSSRAAQNFNMVRIQRAGGWAREHLSQKYRFSSAGYILKWPDQAQRQAWLCPREKEGDGGKLGGREGRRERARDGGRERGMEGGKE